jgi:23S rRNA pseudouridine1911/1915/1917 synthase
MSYIRVLSEDADFVALSKPAGIVMHHDRLHKEGTLVDWLLKKYPEVRGVGESAFRPGIVHRLDKDTSGVVVIAKNNEAYSHFKKQMQDGNVEKQYRALVVGRVKNDKGTIDEGIARSTKDFQKRVVGGKQGRVRDAVTNYQVIERFGDEYTLLAIQPKTGRTHQIRSHMKHIGHSVACDQLYGGKQFICPGQLSRQFLHAYSLEFVSRNGKTLRILCEIPEDLEGVLKQLRN